MILLGEFCKISYQNMKKINLVPKSGPGRWSVGLIVIVPILFYVGMSSAGLYASVTAGKTIPQDIIARPGVALPMLAGFVSGIWAFFAGIIGITRKKDLSVLAIISTASGFLVLLWVIAEILLPH